MDEAKFKVSYGDEYPAALVEDGVRIPLTMETQFTRYYQSKAPNTHSHQISRFMDGSTSITAVELARDWPGWTDSQRFDFCNSCCWLYKQADFPDMLRYMMAHGGPDNWCAIATSIAAYLPGEEAFRFFVQALKETSVEHRTNIVQGIAITKHAEAEATIREQLRVTWEHPDLWKDADFVNWVAHAAQWHIHHLIELGALPAEFEDQVRQLSKQICAGNRAGVRRDLAKYYEWLKE